MSDKISGESQEVSSSDAAREAEASSEASGAGNLLREPGASDGASVERATEEQSLAYLLGGGDYYSQLALPGFAPLQEPASSPVSGNGVAETSTLEQEAAPQGQRDVLPQVSEKSEEIQQLGEPQRVKDIWELQVYDGSEEYPSSPDKQKLRLLDTSEVRRILADFAIGEGLVRQERQEPGNFAPSPGTAEWAVATALGSVPFGPKVPVDVPVPAQPGEDPTQRAGFEVKLSHDLPDAQQGGRLGVVYGLYAKADIQGLPPQWEQGWKDNSSPAGQERAREIADALYQAVMSREATGARLHNVDPERVIAVVFAYDPGTREVQLLQFERGAVFPSPSSLDWHFSKSGKGLMGVDPETKRTVVNWNRDRGQINVYINPAHAIRRSDIFPLDLPGGYSRTSAQWRQVIYPGL